MGVVARQKQIKVTDFKSNLLNVAQRNTKIDLMILKNVGLLTKLI